MPRLRRLASSVKVRVTFAALLALGAALVTAVVLVDASLQHDRRNVLETTAQYEAREIMAFNPYLKTPLALPGDATIQTGLVQVIRNGRVVGASPLLRRFPALWAPGEPEVQNTDPLEKLASDVHVVTVPVNDNGVAAEIVVVTSLDQYDRSVAFIHRLLLVGTPALLAVVGFICWNMVGRALRPIELMRREVDEVAGITGAHRLAEPESDDEVARLARTLNSMLDRIESSSVRERRFVSDASHELRSPIANIRTELEVALHRPELADWSAVAKQVLAQNERMQDLVEGLLILARSDEGSLIKPAGVVDLSVVADSLVRGYQGRLRPGLSLRLAESCPALVAVPEVYLERMVANLVDNAVRYARTQVSVEVTCLAGWGHLRVRDDGPGVPEAQRQRIFERFVRLDEGRDRGMGGFGLGLAIVADLCRFYGGRVSLEANGSPGACFCLSFPCSGPKPALPEWVSGASAR